MICRRSEEFPYVHRVKAVLLAAELAADLDLTTFGDVISPFLGENVSVTILCSQATMRKVASEEQLSFSILI
jgi:hypothetical protein